MSEIDWEVVDDLVADGWTEEDARRFATGPPLLEHQRPRIADMLNAKQELSARLLEPVFDHLFEQALRDRRYVDASNQNGS